MATKKRSDADRYKRREEQIQQLDRLKKAAWEAYEETGSQRALDRVLRVMNQESKLLGFHKSDLDGFDPQENGRIEEEVEQAIPIPACQTLNSEQLEFMTQFYERSEKLALPTMTDKQRQAFQKDGYQPRWDSRTRLWWFQEVSERETDNGDVETENGDVEPDAE